MDGPWVEMGARLVEMPTAMAGTAGTAGTAVTVTGEGRRTRRNERRNEKSGNMLVRKRKSREQCRMLLAALTE